MDLIHVINIYITCDFTKIYSLIFEKLTEMSKMSISRNVEKVKN